MDLNKGMHTITIIKKAPHRDHQLFEVIMTQKKYNQLFIAGNIAAAAILLLTRIFVIVGIEKGDIASLYGSVLDSNHEVPEFLTGVWFAGAVTHFILAGFLLPLVCDFLVNRHVIKNIPMSKSILWGSAIWASIEMIIKPLTWQGFFSTYVSNPGTVVVASFISWLLYAYVFEVSLKWRVQNTMHPPTLPHAHSV